MRESHSVIPSELIADGELTGSDDAMKFYLKTVTQT